MLPKTYSQKDHIIWDTDETRSLSLTMQLNLKQIKLWFAMWHDWQKRIAICRIIENCPKAGIELLTTSLEPVLHLDFSTSLSPIMAALHHEGARTFKIQRNADFTAPIITATRSEHFNKTDSSTSLQDVCPPQPTTIPESSSLPTTITNSLKWGKKHPSTAYQPLATKPDPVFLPTIETTHSKHKLSPASSDFARTTTISHSVSRITESSSSPLHRSYNSVPDIRSSVNMLQMTKQYSFPIRGTRRRRERIHGIHKKTRSFATMEERRLLQHRKHRQLELYKMQLNSISEWMKDCQVANIAVYLLNIIKMSDKALLGYLVQCLYQRLQLHRGIDGLSDKLLLKIFSYLDPPNLLRCRMVCSRWYYLTGNNPLWRRHCEILGTTEGIGNIVGAIEAVHKITTLEGKELSVMDIDWLQAFKDLFKLIQKIKLLVKKSDLYESEHESSRPMTRSQIRSAFTLREMLDSVRATSRVSNLSTHETVLIAPESAASRRRRLRAQRTQRSNLKEQDLTTNAARPQYTTNDQKFQFGFHPTQTCHLVDCGIDKRPTIPSLPNPDGIQCLVLAGFLLANEKPRPGKVAPIPTLGRIKLPEIIVLCLECDERKIIAGCTDRLIRIYDLRSGRHFSTLQGHKGSVQCLQFDEHKLVSGSWDTTCIVWDIVRFSVVKELIGHTDCISCLKFHDSTLVTGSYDNSIRIWEVTSWECLQTIYPAHKKPITCLAFNGLDIFSGSEDNTVKVWNPVDGSKRAELKHTARLMSMVLSKLLLITACSDGDMYLWDLRTMSVVMQWKTDYETASAAIVSISLDRGKVYAASSDSIVYEWDIATGTCVRSLQGHSTMLTSIWAGCNRIVTSSEDHTLSVWNTKKANEEKAAETDLIMHNQFIVIPVRVITGD